MYSSNIIVGIVDYTAPVVADTTVQLPWLSTTEGDRYCNHEMLQLVFLRKVIELICPNVKKSPSVC